MAKIIFDKVLAVLLLVLFSPLSLLICLAIKLEGFLVLENRGPIIHQEQRVSQGRVFSLYKFRILKLSAVEEIQRGKRPKDVENRRENLTNVGRMLKKIGLDEIPQYWNILKGDMSFVGPRPKPVAEYQKEIAKGIYRRKVIRAGLSGPAQVMKGTNRTHEDELKADLEYIHQCRTLSAWKILLIDLGVLAKTIKVLFKRVGE
ncbi:MAG: sugar transferase [Actinomycetota bacterium]|nr:sugar transferase [Actinomycetota bacterium]